MALAIFLFAVAAAADLSRGLSMYRQQQFGAAELELRSVLKADPRNSTARIYLARTMIELNRVPEALIEIEKVLEGPGGPELKLQAGHILRDLAERRFEQLEAAAPGSPPVHELAGARFERTGDLPEALKQYRTAAALDPKRPGVHYRIGNILWRMRELDAASEALEKELAAGPHHSMANLRLAQVLLARNENELAIPYLERSVAAMPSSIEARRELGKAYRNAGRLTDARREWEHVAKAQPGDNQIHYLLGNLYRDLGEAAQAKRELETHRQILQRRRHY